MEDTRKFKCPFGLTLDLISRKWIATILWHLQDIKRFKELERRIPGIPRKVLVQHLRELEKYGIIRRTIYAEVPPRVEYSLTEMGQELAPIFKTIAKWGNKHHSALKPGLCIESMDESKRIIKFQSEG